MENIEDLNYLELVQNLAKEHDIDLKTAVLLLIAEEINLLRREINELKIKGKCQ